MTTYTSTGAGNWNAVATWGGGGYPVTGDKAIVRHTVTVNVASACKQLDCDVGGSIVMNEDLTMDDDAAAWLTIRDDFVSWTTNGTAASPRDISSASANPTNKWRMIVEDVVGKDSRVLNFDYVKLRGNRFLLGNDVYYQDFNAPGDDQPQITSITPKSRPPRTVEHDISGNLGNRVYHDGTGAGVMVLSGSCSHDSFLPKVLEKMADCGLRLSFFGYNDHLPKCFLDRPPSYRPRGGLYMDFTITIKEDAT